MRCKTSNWCSIEPCGWMDGRNAHETTFSKLPASILQLVYKSSAFPGFPSLASPHLSTASLNFPSPLFYYHNILHIQTSSSKWISSRTSPVGLPRRSPNRDTDSSRRTTSNHTDSSRMDNNHTGSSHMGSSHTDNNSTSNLHLQAAGATKSAD